MSPTRPVEINVEKKNGASLVTISGHLAAAETGYLSAALEDLVAEQVALVIVDLSDVDLITSEGLGVLIRARKNVAEYDGRLVLCGLTGNVLDVFRMTRLDKVFVLYESSAAALSATPE